MAALLPLDFLWPLAVSLLVPLLCSRELFDISASIDSVMGVEAKEKS